MIAYPYVPPLDDRNCKVAFNERREILFASFLALAIARPGTTYDDAVKIRSEEPRDFIKIVRDDRVHPQTDGSYSFHFETENGISRSESGRRLENLEEEPVGQQGSYSFTLPNGELFELKFVANENGFQPESDSLPQAPAFPHPIPQFVLDQIAFAERQRQEADVIQEHVLQRQDIPTNYNFPN